MRIYQDQNKQSNIIAFNADKQSFRILLKNGTYCIFSTPKVTLDQIQAMTQLAEDGEGLREYIVTNGLLDLAKQI